VRIKVGSRESCNARGPAGRTAKAAAMTIDRLLLGLVFAIGVYAFDDLALSTILPAVAAELAGDRLYSASFLAFLLTNLASLVATGYLIDRIGVARPFVGGMGLFVAGLLLGYVAPSMPVFVAGRALQGLGGGAIQAVVTATIALAWHGAARQRAISWVTTAWMVPALVGPFMAGSIATLLDWRYVFAALALLALVTTLLAWPRVRVVPRAVAAEGDEAVPLPLAGAVVVDALVIAVATGVALAALEHGGKLGIAVACGAALALARPLARSLPAQFWHVGSPLAAIIFVRMVACAVFFGIEAWLPWTANRSGLMAPIMAGVVLSAAAGGWTAATWWVDGALKRMQPWPILGAAGALLITCTTLTAWAIGRPDAIEILFLAWCGAGAAMGLIYPVVSALAMARVQRGREGRLSMMLGLGDTLGITSAIGMGGAILRAAEPGALERVVPVWLGFIALAALIPFVLCWRRSWYRLPQIGHGAG